MENEFILNFYYINLNYCAFLYKQPLQYQKMQHSKLFSVVVILIIPLEALWFFRME